MALAMTFESAEIDGERYDSMMSATGRAEVGAPAPYGALLHMAGPVPDGGWRVVDVRRNQETADAFYASATFQSMFTRSTPTISAAPWPLHRFETFDPPEGATP